MRQRSPWRVAIVAAALSCAIAAAFAHARAEEDAYAAPTRSIWTCRYIAATPDGPLQITTRFQVIGDELAEVETVPRGLSFGERYKILENSDSVLVAAISIARIGEVAPPGIGAVVVWSASRRQDCRERRRNVGHRVRQR